MSVPAARHVRRRAGKGAENRAVGHATPRTLRQEGEGPEQAGPARQSGQALRRRRLAPSLGSRLVLRASRFALQGNQNTAASTRRGIDACAQARATQACRGAPTSCADNFCSTPLALQRGDIEGALALFRRAKAEVMRLLWAVG